MADILGPLPGKQEFSQQVDSFFRAFADGGDDVDLVLIKFTDLSPDETQENYSLVFRAPIDATQNQGIFRLSHDELGEMDIFLVPISRDESGLYFEAVFNRLVGQKP